MRHRPLDVLIAQKAQKEESKTAFLFLIMGFSLLSASEFLQTEKWRCAKQ